MQTCLLREYTEQHRDLYRVICEQGEIGASVSGKLAYHADNQTSFPAVGDWVMIDRVNGSTGNAVIHHILRRQSVLSAASCRYGKFRTGHCGQY